MGRIVGIDFGTRRTGIAVADPLGMFARTLGTFSPDEALAALRRLDADEGITIVVIGWPLTPDGKEGAAVERTAAYARRIEKALPHARIEQMDERFTSAEARELMLQAGVPRQRREKKGRLDAAAAAVILQSYLDSKTGT